jgi:hypothetical protein
MKSELELKTHHSGVNNNSPHGNVSIFSPQRKGQIHDLSSILVEDCQKVFLFTISYTNSSTKPFINFKYE